MSARHSKIHSVLMKCVVTAIMNGLDYKEGMAMFRAGATLMEQIDKTPDADENALEKLAIASVEAELNR